MKKAVISLTMMLLFLTATVYANSLNFIPDGGGYFIYCNNNENIRRMDLSDTSNPEPSYIMNNLNMGKGQYTLYFSHNNHTELAKTPKPTDPADVKTMDKEVLERLDFTDVIEDGFDIEADVLFHAKEDTKVRLTAVGFEVQDQLNYYYTNQLIRYEDSWGCMNAVSDYMQRPLYGLDSVSKFFPRGFEAVDIEIKAGDVMWLSEYIANYSVVPWLKPVHLLADFEIVYGCADINIAALKSTGILRDRSNHCMDAKHGAYYRDKQYKGVADTLPSTTAHLEYSIDDTTADGTLLPVTVHNTFVPEGNTVTTWITHLNPQNDRRASKIIAENDILQLKYYDPAKQNYYGKDVPESEKDSVWIFDTLHSDVKKFDPVYHGNAKDSFRPNSELDLDRNNTQISGNFANYCVKTNYHLKINNSGESAKFFNYIAHTTSAIVVSLKDKDGNYLSEHSVHKAHKDYATSETLAVLELPPQTETEFILEVFLPINYVGGIQNSFKITDTETVQTFLEDKKEKRTVDRHFTGKNYIRWENNELMISDDNQNWQSVPVSQSVRHIFEDNGDNYKITYFNGNYVVMWYSFVPSPAYYTPYLKHKRSLFFLDENFNLINTVTAANYPEELSVAADKVYLKTNIIYETTDGKTWTESNIQNMNLPVDNHREVILASRVGGETFLSPDKGANFYPIALRYDVKRPRYVDVLGDIYFYAEADYVYVTRDGVEWTRLPSVGEKVNSVMRIDNTLIVNGDKTLEIPDLPSYTNVVINGTVMQYDRLVRHYDNGTQIPLEMTMEQLGIKYEHNKKNNTVIINHNGITVELHTGSTLVKVNNKKFHASCSTQFYSDRVFIPAKEVMTALGFKVEYIKDANTMVISQ